MTPPLSPSRISGGSWTSRTALQLHNGVVTERLDRAHFAFSFQEGS